VSTGAIVTIVIVGLLAAGFIPLRIDVARQRRAVETARARLAAATVRRQAASVPVHVILKIGSRDVRVTRASSVALAADGLYCLSDDGRWGGRVRFAPGPPGVGDFALADEPSLSAEGLVLGLAGGITWIVAVPQPDEWYAALKAAIPGPR